MVFIIHVIDIWAPQCDFILIKRLPCILYLIIISISYFVNYVFTNKLAYLYIPIYIYESWYAINIFNYFFFISGKWPRWLEGTMYRVGPGIIQVGDNCYKHPFDMLSVIHKYKLSSEKNKCSYQNKIVDSEVSKTFC